MNMKWVWIGLLIVVGIVAAVVSIEYLTTGIGHLPSWIPGHQAGKRGHFNKRGYGAALIAVVAFAGAGWLIYKNQQAGKSGNGSSTS